ncbi:N-alpha-acetyltransferase 35, NatC auxiliary subunit-like [Artemia franciscana]|uniref:Protein MAK10 homolog n=1 Tax=Artemia franciscana TaxID=6661 RepID=A0AA88I2Z6_ARTSF|nr:hypothetical protein QYM36_006075 [Artemia franciscana]
MDSPSNSEKRESSAFCSGIWNWINVTEKFSEACQELEIGELVHDGSFGLFEAMSAIEIMDPKMDAGMVCNTGKNVPYTFETAVEAGVLPLDNIALDNQIDIIDASLGSLVSWLEGNGLAQTLFTNLYLHQPYSIVDKCQKAVSLCLLKIVDLVRDIIVRVAVFEEEDFQPITYGFKLPYEITDVKVIGMLKEVEEEFSRITRRSKQKSSEGFSEELQKQFETNSAVFSRLKLLRHLHQLLLSFSRREGTNLDDCPRHINGASDAAQQIAKQIEQWDSADFNDETNGPYWKVVGFEPRTNHRLLPPTFPRYSNSRTKPSIYQYLLSSLDKLQVAFNISNVNGFHQALEFLAGFSRRADSCVLSRSILQLYYLPIGKKVLGKTPFSDVLKETAKNFCSPPSLVLKSPLLSSQLAKEYLDSFMLHCCRAFGNVVQLYGNNMARQRDRLIHILEEFSALQEEADKADAYLHSVSIQIGHDRNHLTYFGTWILYHILRLMVRFILSGLELELFSSFELHYVYWYMYEFLFGWLISALSRAENMLSDHENYAEAQNQRSGRGASKAHGKGAPPKQKKKKCRPYLREMMMYQAMQHISGGLYKSVMCFLTDGKISLPLSHFDREKVRYEHRFVPFACISTPPPVPYAQFYEVAYRSMADIPGQSHSPILALSACKHFSQAKTVLEAVQNPDDEVASLLRVCKVNYVVMKLVSGGHKQSCKFPPEFDFSVHPHFPTIKLV